MLGKIRFAEGSTELVGADTWHRLDEDLGKATATAGLTDQARQWLVDMLTESNDLRLQRNDVMHAIAWLAPETDDGPMQSVRPNRRQHNLVTHTEWTLDQMHTLAARMYQLGASLNSLGLGISFDAVGMNVPTSHKVTFVNPHDPTTWPAGN